MRRVLDKYFNIGLTVCCVLVCITVAHVSAQLVDGEADLVIGQGGLTYNGVNMTDGKGILQASDVAVDTNIGRLYVCDKSNHRVLWWDSISSLSSGEEADGAIGQESLTTADLYRASGVATTAGKLYAPEGIGVDSVGNLWVADTGNHRVLKFAAPVTTAEDATVVLGQANFTGNSVDRTGVSADVTANSLSSPADVTVDGSGNVWIADDMNNRVIRYSSPITSGMDADFVLGQQNLTSQTVAVSSTALTRPTGITIDSNGAYWVADRSNNRVVRFSSTTVSGGSADFVLGQADFVSKDSNRGGSRAANTLYIPKRIAVETSGNVWVVDQYNYRVLRYSSPSVNGQSADLVIGQPDFTSREINNSEGEVAANTLYWPSGVIFDGSSKLWISSLSCHRVLRYSAAFSNNMDADIVLGQQSFTYQGQNSIDNKSISSPVGIAKDSLNNRLYIADSSNTRVLWFENMSSLSSGAGASGVLGHAVFYSILASETASGCNSPQFVAIDGSTNVWISDYFYNRVLRYATPSSSGEESNLVLGQANFTSVDEDGGGTVNAGVMDNPRGICFDGSGNLWVIERDNRRIVQFVPPFSSGMYASVVLGQPDFTTDSAQTLSARSLQFPIGGIFDSSGNLWVADSGNHRVLRFSPPFSNNMESSLVLGQADFTSSAADRGGSVAANTLDNPYDVAEDKSGNIWVADSNNHRVLMYAAPFSNGMNAAFVIGQSNFASESANSGSNLVSAGSLKNPYGLMVDASGNLWISDNNNYRTLRYTALVLSSITPSSGYDNASVSITNLAG